MNRFAIVVALVAAVWGVAAATPTSSSKARPAWVGVFRATPADLEPCPACDKPTVVGHAGTVVVLTPGEGTPAPTGDVTLVQPLVGMNLEGHLDRGRVDVPLFAIDRREGADAVLVLPAHTTVVFVEPSKADIAAIRAALLRNEVLSRVKRALDGLEIGAIDVDGDHKADFAVTYGCNAWADGQCQSHGEFLLASRGNSWVEIE